MTLTFLKLIGQEGLFFFEDLYSSAPKEKEFMRKTEMNDIFVHGKWGELSMSYFTIH